jgi:hypothetical protein
MDNFNQVEAMRQRIARLKTETESLKELWFTVLPPDWLPSDRQFFTWLGKYDFQIVGYGIETASNRLNRKEIAAEKDGGEIQWSKDSCVSFASGVMKQQTLRGDNETAREDKKAIAEKRAAEARVRRKQMLDDAGKSKGFSIEDLA